MYKLNTLKQSILIVSFATLVTGCGGGGTGTSAAGTSAAGTSASNTSTASEPVISNLSSTIASTSTAGSTAVAKAIQKGQVTDSSTGKGLENVKVSIGPTITTTDANGYYSFSNLTSSEETTINFEKEGYLLGSTQIQLKSLSGDNTPSTNYLEYSLYPHKYQWDYDSSDGIDGAHIIIDTSASYIR